MNVEENETLSKLETIKKLIAEKIISSDVLAAQVVLYRSIGMNKEIALLCMEELGRRRGEGDVFNYENFIDTEVAKIPKVDINVFKTLSDSFTMQAITKILKKTK